MNTTPVAVSTESPNQLPYEVEQFCTLLARIYARCLQEQKPEVITRLAGTTNAHQEAQHAAA